MSVRSPQKVRLSIEQDLVKVQSVRRCEEEIKIFKGLGQDEAFHFIALFFCDYVLERGVAGIYPAIFHKVVEDLFSHLSVLRIAREVMQIVGRFHDLGAQMVTVVNNLHRLVIEDLRLDPVHVPHLER